MRKLPNFCTVVKILCIFQNPNERELVACILKNEYLFFCLGTYLFSYVGCDSLNDNPGNMQFGPFMLAMQLKIRL